MDSHTAIEAEGSMKSLPEHMVKPLDSTETKYMAMLKAEHEYMIGFHTFVILIAIFGASITFPLFLTPLIQPTNPSNLQTVRTLIAVSWALFVVALLLACLACSGCYAHRYLESWTEYAEVECERGRGRWFLGSCQGLWFKFLNCQGKTVFGIGVAFLTLLFVILPIGGAMICLSVVVAMYIRAVGIASMACIGTSFVSLVLFNLFSFGLQTGTKFGKWKKVKTEKTEKNIEEKRKR